MYTFKGIQMTLKHIEFNDSPVMRELARQAIKNGTVSPDLSTMVKMAAAKKGNVYAPSGDLFTDMVRLADGLRSKGLVRDAEVLEQKILAHKLAQVELDKLLDEAHPEGDVEVADAEDDLGVVETLESVHDRVMEAVKKQPTGKQAMVQTILKIAEGILKGAQVPTPKADSQEPAAQDVAPTVEEMEESALGAPRNEKIDRLNAEIAEAYSGIGTILSDGLSELDWGKWAFTPEAVFNNSDIRASYSDILADTSVNAAVDQYTEKCTKLLGKLVYPNEMYPILNQKLRSLIQNPEAMRQTVGIISQDLVATYCYGLAEQNDEEQFNQSSIWEYAWPSKQRVLVPGNFTQLLNAAFNAMRSLYITATGDDKIAKASAALVSQAQAIVKPYQAVAASFKKKAPKIGTDAKSARMVIDRISKEGSVVQSYTSQGEQGAEFLRLAHILWPSWTPSLLTSADEAMEKVRGLISFINENAINENDVLLTEDMITNIAGPLAGAVKNLVLVYKRFPENSAQYKKMQGLALATQGALNAVKSMVGNTFINLSQALASTFPAASYKELLSEVQGWLGETTAIVAETVGADAVQSVTEPFKNWFSGKETQTDRVSADDGIVTTAAPGGLRGTLKQPEAPAADTAAGVRPNGTFSGTLSAAEKEAVKKMQAVLVQLGDKKNPEWKKVGKDGSPTPDGAWGSGTAKILESVKTTMATDKFTGGTIESGPRPGFGWGGYGTKTIERADANTKVLTAYLTHVGGGASSGAKSFGAIAAVSVEPIWNTDLQSLAGLYDYLIRAGAKEVSIVDETTFKQVIGLPRQTFDYALGQIKNYADNMYAQGSGDPLAGELYSLANTRYNEYIKRFPPNDPASKNVITKAMLGSFGQSGGGRSSTESGAGFTMYEDANGNKYRHDATDADGKLILTRLPDGGKFKVSPNSDKIKKVDEGDDVSMSNKNQFPFVRENGDLDLSLPYYGRLAAKVGRRVLSLAGISGRDAKTVAYALFAESANAKRALDEFINQLRKDLSRAVRQYSYSGAARSEKDRADDYLAQWNYALEILADDNQNWS